MIIHECQKSPPLKSVARLHRSIYQVMGKKNKPPLFPAKTGFPFLFFLGGIFFFKETEATEDRRQLKKGVMTP